MSNECQIPKCINNPPSPPFSKGGQGGDLKFGFDLAFAMNHVRFMISPELYVVQETLAFDI
jgi:hypothetical protein